MASTNLDMYIPLVADGLRRQIIQHLRQQPNGQATVDELVEELSGVRTLTGNGHPTERNQLLIQVVHSHLPKLADYGVVEYHQEHRTVRYEPNDELEAVLDALPQDMAEITH